jgi:hypothetical protein
LSHRGPARWKLSETNRSAAEEVRDTNNIQCHQHKADKERSGLQYHLGEALTVIEASHRNWGRRGHQRFGSELSAAHGTDIRGLPGYANKRSGGLN